MDSFKIEPLPPTDEAEPAVTRALRTLGRPRALFPLLGLIVLAVIAVSWLARSQSAAAAKRPQPAAVVPVEVAAASPMDVPVYAEGIGTIQALYTDTITSRVDGEIVKLGFTEGQSVKKGALLAEIDPRPYKAALDQAVATRAKDAALLASARRDLDRYAILEPEQLTSKQTVDDQRGVVASLEAQIKMDDAAVESARTQLDYTHIVSPISGRTGIRMVDPGNIVHASDTGGIVVVTQVQPITCIFTLPENALGSIAAALAAGPVSVIALSQDDKTELDRGTVSLIDNRIDATTGTIRLKAQFPNTHDRLWPGEFVNARVLVRTADHALVIPSAAVQHGANGLFTYVVKADSTVEMRPLKVGLEESGFYIIEQGLQNGERVVTSNQYRLVPGSTVRIE
jgi:multidrug efflux system membrane fusion protein